MLYDPQELAIAPEPLAKQRVNWQPWVTGKVDKEMISGAKRWRLYGFIRQFPRFRPVSVAIPKNGNREHLLLAI